MIEFLAVPNLDNETQRLKPGKGTIWFMLRIGRKWKERSLCQPRERRETNYARTTQSRRKEPILKRRVFEKLPILSSRLPLNQHQPEPNRITSATCSLHLLNASCKRLSEVIVQRFSFLVHVDGVRRLVSSDERLTSSLSQAGSAPAVSPGSRPEPGLGQLRSARRLQVRPFGTQHS